MSAATEGKELVCQDFVELVTEYLEGTLPAEDQAVPDAVLKRLSDNFELCVYGLNEVRRQWSERDGEIEPPLLLG